MLNVQCTIEGTSGFLMNRYKMAISTETGGVKKNARTGEPDWFSEWKEKCISIRMLASLYLVA